MGHRGASFKVRDLSGLGEQRFIVGFHLPEYTAVMAGFPPVFDSFSNTPTLDITE